MTSIRQRSGERPGDQASSADEFVAELQRAVDQREIRLEAMTAELAGTRADLERTRKLLEATHRSISWRATAPLRALREVVAAAATAVRRATGGAAPLPPDAPSQLLASPEPDESASAAAMEGDRFDFLYLVGSAEGAAARYRVQNPIESLRGSGYRVAAFDARSAADLQAHRICATRVIVFRGNWNPNLRDYLAFARDRGSIVVLDLEEPLFETASLAYLPGLSGDGERQSVPDAAPYRAMLRHCDRVTVPTEFLAERVRSLGKPVEVVPDTLGAAEIALAETCFASNRDPGATLTIGYAASAEQDENFAVCADAVLEFLGRHAGIRFRIVGPLALPSAFDIFAPRIERLPALPPLERLRRLAEIDINLAPLEIGNPFSESRSACAVFEAGLLGVPTVASRTRSHAEAIAHGVDGLLAAEPDDWRVALDRLASSPQDRANMGRHARERALRQFGPPALRECLHRLYGLEAESRPTATPAAAEGARPAQMRSDRPLRINFLVPGLIIGGGGHRNILRAAYHLSRFGHDVRLYFTGTSESPEQLAQLIRQHFFPLTCPVAVYAGEMAQADVIFATHWSTVATALQQRARCREIFYFVQDFEPMFYAMGSDYILAENTYRLGLYHITSGPWCAEILRRQFNADADSFVFPIQTVVYWPRPRSKPNQNLLFFAKPEMPRRCFGLGLEALRLIKEARPTLEIITFGSDEVAADSLPFPATRKGLIRRLEDLALLYSNADLGIVFSPTNPSLVPFEMLACGLPVVDLDRPGAEVNFGRRRDIALLADPDPRVFARQVLRLLDDSDERERRALAGREFVKTFPDEEGMARRFEFLVLNRLRKTVGLAAD